MKNNTLISPDTATERLFKRLFWITAGVLLIVMPLMSLKMGINGDDRFLTPVTNNILSFYKTFDENHIILRSAAASKNTEDYRQYEKEFLIEHFGVDDVRKLNNKQRKAFEAAHKTDYGARILKGWKGYIPGYTPQYYGGLFEFLHAVLNKIFGYDNELQLGYHNVRHALVSIFGWTAMVFTSLIAMHLMGWRAAFLALIFIFLSPRFLGHSLMNPKDLPFATAYAMAGYFMLRFLSEIPRPGWKTIAGLIAGIAMAINIRVGGILLIVYLFFFTGLYVLYGYYIDKSRRLKTPELRQLALRLAMVALGGYLLGLVFWPYGLLDPLRHPVEALRHFSNFHANIVQLYRGEQIFSKDLPGSYLTVWLLISNPVVVIAGFFGALAFALLKRKELPTGWMAICLFMVVFPLVYIVYKKSNVYSGWRHVLFVYPFIVALAASGWETVFRWVSKDLYRYLTGALVGVMLINPLRFIIQNHPYEYTYFNVFVGGLKGAYTRYTTDYWMISVREACEWLAEHELADRKDEPLIVATNCWYPANIYLHNLAPNVKVKYVKYYERDKKDWDYGIFYIDYVHPVELKGGLWPPPGTIYTVKADGVSLCAVIKRNQH